MKTIPIVFPLSCVGAGLCALPASRAQKRPAVGGAWREWRTKRPSEQNVHGWWKAQPDAMCIVCGAVSGNLECLDFDSGGRAMDAWSRLVPDEIGKRLYVESTPSGGFHVCYRCQAPVCGNRKLARDADGKVLVETRGEGGVFLCAPSEGYETKQGTLFSLPVLTESERQALIGAAASLDETAKQSPAESSAPSAVASPAKPCPKPSGASVPFSVRPGDDFCARGDIRPVLERHGWVFTGHDAKGNETWRRPGKSMGQSATFNGATFYVFSSNAMPFEPMKGYGKFTVFAMLEHGGDMTAAAAALLAMGYGQSGTADMGGVDLSALVGDSPPAPETPPAAGDVDLSALDASAPDRLPDDAELADRTALSDPGPMPSSFYEVPGFIGALASYMVRTATYPNKPVAFAAALAFMSFLVGRRWRSATGLRANLYIIAVADSGSGKEHPKSVNERLAASVGMVDRIGGRFASGEGLEDAMDCNPPRPQLYQIDEISFFFSSFRERDRVSEGIVAALLQFYSASSGLYIKRSKARQDRMGKATGGRGKALEQPYLVLFGMAQPRRFYETLTEDALENGLVGRCLVIEGDGRNANFDPVFDEDFPAVVLDAVQAFQADPAPPQEFDPDVIDGSAGMQETCRAMPETEGGTEENAKTRNDADAEWTRARNADNEPGKALWARAWEKAMKLAMLRAASRRPDAPEIDAEDWQWARAVAFHATRRMIWRANQFVFKNLYDKECKSILRLISQGCARRGPLLARSHIPKRTFDEVVATLLESGQLVQNTVETRGRPAIVYSIAGSEERDARG